MFFIIHTIRSKKLNIGSRVKTLTLINGNVRFWNLKRFFRCGAKVAYARIKYFTLFRPSLHLICDWQWNVNNKENKAYDKKYLYLLWIFLKLFFIHTFLFQMILSCYIEFIQNIIWTYDEQWRVNFLKEIVNIKQNVYTLHENDANLSLSFR